MSGGGGERVLLADDHALARAAIRSTLVAAGFSVVAEAASAPEAVAAAASVPVDLCLLDIHMPGGGGPAACAEILDAAPAVKVVMLTASLEEEDLFAALSAGASGYLVKDMDPDRIPFALRGVLAGEAAIPRVLTARVIEEFRTRRSSARIPALRARGVDLSDREWEILRLLAEDLSTRELAARVGISEITVRRHIGALLRKLRVPDRESAIALLRDAPPS